MKKALMSTLNLPNGGQVRLAQAVITEGFVYTSGQLSIDKGGALISDCFEEQARQAFENLTSVLSDAGSDMSSVIKLNGWNSNQEDFPFYNTIYKEYFPDSAVARTTLLSA